MTLPLEGLRVLDLTRALAGPFCSQMLGDMGADVLKVEQPGVGDNARGWGPPFQGGESSYFLSVNRNKRSVVLDLKSETGRQAARDLAAACDVLVENFRPGTAARLGLGPEELTQANPRLVYASISGFGQGRPTLALACVKKLALHGPLPREPGHSHAQQSEREHFPGQRTLE